MVTESVVTRKVVEYWLRAYSKSGTIVNDIDNLHIPSNTPKSWEGDTQ